MFCKHCGSELKEGAGFCVACGKPVGSAAGGAAKVRTLTGANAGGKKGLNKWMLLIPLPLIALAVILFLVFRGGSAEDNAFRPYEGTWTQSMDNSAISMNIDRGRGYNTLEINNKSVIFRGDYSDFLAFEGWSTEKFELPIDEFEYQGNSGVKYLDNRKEYVKKEDKFIPVESYEYYYHTIHDLGLAFCTLSNGDTAICLLVNPQDFENTISGITVSSYKSTNNPADWIYAVTYSR